MLRPLGQGEGTDRIIRRKLSDEVLDRLRTMIRSGELRAGDAMPSERALMDRFGVGRPAVREALQALHQQGLISISHGERTRVQPIDAGTVLARSDEVARMLLDLVPANRQHLKEARTMFELGLVRLAAERATASDVAALRDAVAVQRAQMGGDPVPFIEADMAFHARIATISGNPIITAASQAMLRWLFEYHTALLHWSGREAVTLADHAAIVDAIEARDAEGAVQAMADHLNRSRDALAPVDQDLAPPPARTQPK